MTTIAHQDFLERFFGPGNAITWAEITTRTLPSKQLEYLDSWLPAFGGNEPGPIVLPRRATDRDETTYYAIALSDKQGRLLREDLLAFIGMTYTDFTGVDVHLDPNDPVEAAVADLIGPVDGRSYRFKVTTGLDTVDPVTARTRVQRTLAQLRALWDARPDRTRPVPKPTGRLLRDFYQAINAADDDSARAAIQELRQGGRLSAVNFTYLEIQRLAATRQWNALLDLEQLPTLLQVGRPPRVTDAIAQAVYRVHTPAATEDPDAAVEVFASTVVPTYGVLFEAASQVRSVDGARYALLASHALPGSPPTDPAALLAGPYGEDDLVRSLAARLEQRSPEQATVEPDGSSLDAIALELEHRRPERAYELLQREEPSIRSAEPGLRCAAKLQRLEVTLVMLEAVESLAPADREVLLADRYLQVIYEDLFASLGELEGAGVAVVAVPTNWVDWLFALDQGGPGAVSLSVARDGAEQWASEPQFTEPTQIAELTALLVVDRPRDAAEAFWQALPHLIAALERADGPSPDLRSVYDALFGVMALRIIEDHTTPDLAVLQQLLDWLLELGLDQNAYAERLSDIADCWSAVASPRTLDWAMDTLDLLLCHPIPDRGSLDQLAAAVFEQVRLSATRMDEVTKAASISIARDFAQAEQLAALFAPTGADPLHSLEVSVVPPGSMIALYSLTEGALQRARDRLEADDPGITVEICDDHVCTEHLKTLARSASLFVVATRSAKHAATDCIAAHRPSGLPLVFTAGKGSSSLVGTVRAFFSQT